MAQFMIHWKSLDPKVTTSLFASGILDLSGKSKESDTAKELLDDVVIPQGMEVITSWHVVGQAMGFTAIQAKPEQIHQLILALPPGAFETTIYDVVDDAEAQKAMATRSSGYKLK